MKKNFLRLTKVVLATVLLFPGVALAQTLPSQALPSLQFIPTAGLGAILFRIIQIMEGLAGALAVIFLIYSGILYIASAGNAEKAQTGKNGVIYAIIGIAIILLSYAIIGWVRELLGS